jgi:uncharacterized protein YndB with AHSA1/START domain
MTSKKSLSFTVERVIPAPQTEVFDAWLDPKVPGTLWNAAERFIVDARVDGLFYWTLKGTSHYGRFTAFERPRRIEHTWVSPNTLGEESTVTVTFERHGNDTRMTLVHSGLPDHDNARGHETGWDNFVDVFRDQFGDGSRRPYRWQDAHPSVLNPAQD